MFQNVRMRFIQTCATPYLLTTQAVDSGTLCISQIAGTSTSAGNGLGITGNPNAIPPTNSVYANNTTAIGNLASTFAQVRMS